jgi:hypothetical protein
MQMHFLQIYSICIALTSVFARKKFYSPSGGFFACSEYIVFRWVTSAHLVTLSQSSPHLQTLLAAGLHDLRDWVIVEMFQNCGHIHILDCESWNISNTGLEALAALGQELCEVSFKAVKEISIEGVEMLLVGCKNICKLNVTNCPKIDQDAVAEAASELCDHYVSVSKQ